MAPRDATDGIAPPAYSVQDLGRQSEAPVPVDVDTSAAFKHLVLNPNIEDRKLTVDTCLAHLKLIHAIHNLKEEVGYTDGLFGLHDSRATDGPDDLDLDIVHIGKGVELKDADKIKFALSKIREKRWALFVARATDRYEAWWRSIQGQNALTESDMAEPGSDLYANFPIIRSDVQGLREDTLPPLGLSISLPCLQQAV
jgi:hypothetical protein